MPTEIYCHHIPTRTLETVSDLSPRFPRLSSAVDEYDSAICSRWKEVALQYYIVNLKTNFTALHRESAG